MGADAAPRETSYAVAFPALPGSHVWYTSSSACAPEGVSLATL